MHADVSALAPLKFGYIFVFICYFYTFIIQSFMYNIKTLINISKRGAGIWLSAASLEMITAYSIFQPPSGTKRHHTLPMALHHTPG